ncbi:MAG TPA: A/G-specific adenine glycosylase [Epsilonproteobacteria bacterium]|nr:A/G-specific adenine glycosylase [Campylobacterota bacterium]
MLNHVHQKLDTWYCHHGRHHLPWRQTQDAYKIWISEIMLQQTQVKTVLERFYFPFLETFPTLQDLANASEDEVLKKWEGLGYYTRARNLHKTAQICQDALPLTVSELMALPGIGKSTAHAIAAFAYHTPVPILDANVKRILYRVFGIKKANEKKLWELAYTLFNDKNPYDYNQVLMDIGATLCTAKSTECVSCPFESICKAKDDDPLLYPEKKVTKKVPIRSKNIIIYTHNNKMGLHQRETKFLNGLWGFSETDQTSLDAGTFIGNIVQKYSHFHLHADVYHLENASYETQWFTHNEVQSLALSGADHKALALFIKHHKISDTMI